MSYTISIQNCYRQCGVHRHITRCEAIFIVANQIPVSWPWCSYRHASYVEMPAYFAVAQ